MRVWYVDCGKGIAEDLNCAWTDRTDAITYLKEQAEDCKWHLSSTPIVGTEENKESYVIYLASNEYEQWTVGVTPLFVDEKPYWFTE